MGTGNGLAVLCQPFPGGSSRAYPVIRHRAKPGRGLHTRPTQNPKVQNSRKVKKRGFCRVEVSEITGVVSKEKGDIEGEG